MSGHVQDLLSAYLDGELSPPERGMVEAHLAACEDCSTRLEDFAAVDGALRALPIEAPADYFETFTQRVRERVRGQGAAVVRRRIPVWTWAAAAALLLAVLTPLTLRQAPAPGALLAPAGSAPMADLERKEERAGLERAATAPAAAAPPLQARPKQVPRASAEALDETAPAQADAPVDASTFAAPPSAPLEADRLAENPLEPAAASRAASRDDAEREAAPRPAAPPAGAAPQAAAARAEESQKRAADLQRDLDSGDARDAEKGRTGLADGVLGGAGARAPARKQAAATEDEIAVLRARGRSGAAPTPDDLRALRDDWRGFAARNPAGARGDEARWQVIESGYRAWRTSGDRRDRDVLARDARTYLERGDGTHDERARAILAEVERE